MTDLETAIQRYHEALKAILADYPDRAGRLYDLETIYYYRYQRIEIITDLEIAI